MSSKPSCPLCKTSLQLYYQLRDRLINYFFNNTPLFISNTDIIQSYTYVYNLLEKDPASKMKNQKTYELYEQTFAKVFKKDLADFCERVQVVLTESKGLSSPLEELNVYYTWIISYTRFLHWTFKTFMLIEKNSKSFGKTSLFHQGLLILRDKLILPNYETLFDLIMRNLELFKEGKLKEYGELQYIIQTIGVCGFNKHRSINLKKNDMDIFQFYSINKDTQEKAEIQYETQFFLKNFTTKIIRHLQSFYSAKSEEMIKLSTPEYVQIALDLLKKEEKAADYLYSNNSVKKLIINSIQQVLITRRCEQLLKNEKSGLNAMLEAEDIKSLTNIYTLLKRTSQHKIFAKTYQAYIQKKVISQILPKITPQQQKSGKRDSVFLIINLLYNFQVRTEKIAIAIRNQIKDSNDFSQLTICQNNAFQAACNKSNTVCNFLAYYCDFCLKKQTNVDDVNLHELVSKVMKISKFLYSMDNFLKIYQRLLGIRILYDIFKNKEIELEIINSLKNQVGVGSLAKINSMVTDLKSSDTFNSTRIPKFKNQIHFNLQVMMLTTGSWQINDNKNGMKLVPPELVKACEIYQKQYDEAMPGREINWIFNFGRAIVQVRFDNVPKSLLFLNNYQLLVLLHFQRRQFYSCKLSALIDDLTPEDDAAFMASIQSLVKRGVVLCKTGNPLKIQSKEDIIEFNLKYKPKAVKTFCFEIPRYMDKGQSISKQILNERAFIIQANIIKLMKSKKMLHYHQILSEVPKMCKTFKAETSAIKNQIENSIHKDYLERDSKDINILIYKS